MATVIEGGGETTGAILKWGGGREGGGREEGRVMIEENSHGSEHTELLHFLACQFACYRRKRTQMLTCLKSPLADFVHFKDFFSYFFLFFIRTQLSFKMQR